MTGDHQIRELLQQTSALLETRYQAWSEQLQKLEEDTVAKVKETYRGLRKNAEEWKKDGIKHLTAVIDSLDRGEDTVLKERMVTAFEDLPTVLDRASALPLPAFEPHNVALAATENKPFAVRLEAELPLGAFWNHKLYLLEPALNSLEIVNLVRMEVQHVPLIGGNQLVPNAVWTVLSTGDLFVCGGGQ